MVKELITKKADVALATLDHNNQRKEVIDFSAGLVIYAWEFFISLNKQR